MSLGKKRACEIRQGGREYKGAPAKKGPLAGIHSSKGRRDQPCRKPRDHGPGLPVKTCGAATSTKKEKQERRKETAKTPLPPSVR